MMFSVMMVTDVSLVLKDSNTESENLGSLIRLSVSDSQKTDSLIDVSVIGYNKESIQSNATPDSGHYMQK